MKLVTLLLVVAACTLQADVITETFDPNGYVLHNGLVGFQLPEFNPALGTLISMSWGISGGFQVAADETNCYGPQPIYVPWEAATALSFFGSTIQSTNTGELILEPGICAQTAYIETMLDASKISVPNPSAFIGTGSVPESSNVTVTSTSDQLQLPLDSFGKRSGANFTITYTYIPMPEPRVIVPLLGATSLMLLVLWRRRRRAIR